MQYTDCKYLSYTSTVNAAVKLCISCRIYRTSDTTALLRIQWTDRRMNCRYISSRSVAAVAAADTADDDDEDDYVVGEGPRQYMGTEKL